MKKTLWVLLDSRTGSVGQARGIMQQLNPAEYEITEKTLSYTKLSGLPNFLRGKTLIGLTPESKSQISSPFPDLVSHSNYASRTNRFERVRFGFSSRT